VTGLDPTAAQLTDRGKLFAIFRPIPGARDARDEKPIAVFQALGPAPNGGSTVEVTRRCVALSERVEAGLHAMPLSATGDPIVGQCMARVVDEGRNAQSGEHYAVLNIGSGAGLKPGDEFALLGAPVLQAGFVPLGIDTARGGRCQISNDPSELTPVTARCIVVRELPGQPTLKQAYAVFSER